MKQSYKFVNLINTYFKVPDINQENVFFALHDPNLKNSTIEGN